MLASAELEYLRNDPGWRGSGVTEAMSSSVGMATGLVIVTIPSARVVTTEYLRRFPPVAFDPTGPTRHRVLALLLLPIDMDAGDAAVLSQLARTAAPLLLKDRSVDDLWIDVPGAGTISLSRRDPLLKAEHDEESEVVRIVRLASYYHSLPGLLVAPKCYVHLFGLGIDDAWFTSLAFLIARAECPASRGPSFDFTIGIHSRAYIDLPTLYHHAQLNHGDVRRVTLFALLALVCTDQLLRLSFAHVWPALGTRADTAALVPETRRASVPLDMVTNMLCRVSCAYTLDPDTPFDAWMYLAVAGTAATRWTAFDACVAHIAKRLVKAIGPGHA